MGEQADRIINGEDCTWCGVFLEPGETVFMAAGYTEMKMPSDGTGPGFSVICEDCIQDEL